ncbi:unnamed protein product [Ambrosiozyma monospora]|uniref:Unnamed protein product n=1 Tax=Ambrosiozyma monospora TaxID=43982 RepID=A0ACB5TRU1_AMBMO|nr:unnamed protein product [Ambrosiozyma monospora]
MNSEALDAVHQTYTNLIDLKNTIHAFTTSQFLQFLSVYLPFVHIKRISPNFCYFYCASRFKCNSTMSVKLDEEKGLFNLLYIRPPFYTHNSLDVVEIAKVEYTDFFQDEQKLHKDITKSVQFSDPHPQRLPVDIPEDERFKLELPSKVIWAELVPKLRKHQLYELKSEALKSIHQAYTNLIDSENTIHVFTVSQLLEILSVYLPFVKLVHMTPNLCYLRCSSRFKCTSAMSLKLDEEKGLFYFSYTRPPCHTLVQILLRWSNNSMKITQNSTMKTVLVLMF